MKILLCHNKYQQKGGEDVVFNEEKRLLEANDHEVITFEKDNNCVKTMSKLKLFLKTLWNFDSYKEILSIIRSEKPDVVHFHNTFPLMSPSVYWALKKEGIPIVQTLHNYRLLCPGALFFTKGEVCEKCLKNRTFFQAVKNRCYRNSVIGSAVVAILLRFHRLIGTYKNKIDKFLVLTRFAKDKFTINLLDENKVIVKPNSINFKKLTKHDKRYALFVGRLSKEKGISLIIEAWKDFDIPLLIAGDGPYSDDVEKLSDVNPNVTYLGSQSKDQIQELLSNASFLILPSLWYEGLPMTIIESFASSLPVLASNLGAMSSCIIDKVTGVHFEPGDVYDFKEKVKWMFNNPDKTKQMGINVRNEYEEKYTTEKNYELLMKIYNEVIEENKCKK